MHGKTPTARVTLYRNKEQIHARSTRGRFNNLRWAMVWLTQLVFYGACWLTWAGEGGAPRQALLFDIAHEKCYLFGLVLWPQDALLLAIVLILAATGLFLVTAWVGRVFCGFACPQTVYTSIFMGIEEKVEGDHLARRRLDAAPWTARKLALRATKHGLWLALAAWSGITFVGYFTPIRELLPALAGWRLGPWEGFWVVFYGLFMYLQAGFAREAVCQHMCPYSRFQGVMFDPATRSVAYRAARGEPRRARGGAGAGDCVDCGICVQVCPTGIDIRDGLQYQCINCGLCADACDAVMTRIGKPVGLIGFASELELSGKPGAARPRLAGYGGLLAVCVGLAAWTLASRPLLRVDVLRDRGSLAREAADGRIENAYTLKLINLADAPRDFRVAVSGIDGAEIVGPTRFAGEAGGIRTVQLTVAVPAGEGRAGVRPIAFEVTAEQDAAVRAVERSTFAMP